MKTPVLVAIGVSALALVAAAQKPDAAKPAPAEAKPAAQQPVDRKQAPQKPDAQQIKGLGYSSPQAQKGAPPAAAPKPGQSAAAPAGQDAIARSRNLATMIVNVERAHRDRVARLERLRQIYEKSGGAEQLQRLERLRAKEHARYDAAMRGYERDLGPALFAKVRAALDLNAGQPPAPPPPAAAPVPNAPETPRQERGARQKGGR
jgi:hypothetical protein